MQAQQDRADNAMLRAENETLKTENFRLQASMRNVICPNCGNAAVLGEVSFDEQHLRLENARLKEEVVSKPQSHHLPPFYLAKPTFGRTATHEGVGSSHVRMGAGDTSPEGVGSLRTRAHLERLSCVIARYGHPALQPAPATSAGLLLAPSLDLDMGVYARHFSEQPGMAAACADVMPALAAVRPPQLLGAAVQGMPDVPGQLHFPVGGVFIADQDRALAVDLALTAAAQLSRLCREDGPLWVRGGSDGSELLDMEVFQRTCPWPIDLNHRQQLGGVEMRIEATRDTALVIMNSITLADIFSDVNKWAEMFPSVVYNARAIQVIATGIPGQVNGSLHLMYGEFQFLSPLVPTREAYFFRFCQQNAEEGSWTVVDFPVDGLGDGFQVPFPKYRRRLSGCIIQDMPNGYSKVSWADISEVEDKSAHQIFDPFILNGGAFGAQRWLTVLQRQCERLASLMARNVSDLGVIPSPEARRNMMKLSHRMVRTFCANICFSSTPSWTALSDAPDDTVRISTRKSVDPGQPSGVILCAVSTIWLPCYHEEVFELLTDEQRRSQLDVLSGGNSLQEVAHIANGSHQRNCVSLLRINASSNSSQNVELVLQESSTHPTGGSFVVYANVDVNGIQLAMSGDDPSCIPLLPVGFIMVPAAAPPGFTAAAPNSSGIPAGNGKAPATDSIGCLLTVGLQVLASAVPSAKLNLSSVNAINNHLCNAVHQISAALGCGDGGCGAHPDPAAAAPPNIEEK
ncbi:hypothetical protein Taro_027338 [Colocasia esculenta]|uniref:START domain-containing protein n=1 Tax=Colocasia esculenta TaxID=4460 RepID=A0A843VE92_COLES|nr:hypothetical protein [Colocasia esculenta]